MTDDSDALGAIFPGSGAVSQLMRAHDWAATPLGPPQDWPDALKIPLGIMLTSRFEMWLGWGEELAFFYNDAYVPTLGAKHPDAIGRPVAEVWREIYADVEGRFQSVLRDGVSTWDKALMLLLERRGFPEETYHTFSYSPLRGLGSYSPLRGLGSYSPDGVADGAVQGLMCVVTEETERVISERRLGTLRSLAAALIGALTEAAVLARLQATLDENRKDFPFSLAYLRGPDGGWERNAASDEIGPIASLQWPLDALTDAAGLPLQVTLDEAGAGLPHGAWDRPANTALVVPVARAGTALPVAALVLALNPYRPGDPELVSLAQLIAGQIAGALGNVAALASERRRADRVWQNSRDPIVVVTPAGIFQAVSPSWAAILGRPIADIVGRSFVEFLHPDDAAATRAALDIAAGRGDLNAFENRYVHIDGTPRWISWNTSMEDGLVYAYGRDITESRAQAEALRDVEAALRQSQKMEAVGQLTGGLAHDFNNLLAGISGSLELLQTRLAQGRINDIERYVTSAQGAARRAASLTHRLLAFSRQQTLEPKPTNVNRLVLDMEELVRRTVGPQISVEVVQAPSLWTTLLDPNQLENALLNLCINARDAMPDGGRLTVETANMWLDERAARERDLAAGQYVSLCVTDSGSGMTPEVARRAVDPFFTTKPLGQGTGLGLSMVYGFVRQSGGQLRIYSELGAGTTMCLYLPRFHGEAAVAEPDPAVTEKQAMGQGETIMVVDDEPTVRMLIAEVLHDFGYTVIEAGDAMTGLKILRSDVRVDMLISDVGLPGGMNGRQMADAARTVRPGLKVLFITGYAENAVVGNGYLSPGMHVLTKPFAIEALSSRVKSIMAEQTRGST